ncbi:hypothetical protein KQI68_06885 [Peptoniphilus sp. MSJ-1]|uniref:Uncharacterized protein n=1 Tax=Peptoniphilus ovalis TaxID=2841503 RepID=A0ABS6FHB6_9FIRM|nr:hypothetical protein [Peptoniphilus ovalis]MBU5669564.1 hypothetical protein [Peptoniphilus ovalis]
MKLTKIIFLESDTAEKENIIETVLHLDSHNFITKDALIAIIKYQNELIKEMEAYMADESNRVKTIY